jgi:hypothetical protein
MNEVEGTVIEAKIRYKEILSALEDRLDQLKKLLPDEVTFTTIDDKLLIKMAFLIESKKATEIAALYNSELQKQAQLYLDVDQGMFSEKEIQTIVHNNAKEVRRVNELGCQLFKKVFGNNNRFQFLDKNAIGENKQFTDLI